MATLPILPNPNPTDSPNPLLAQLRRASLSQVQQPIQAEPAPLPPPQAQADTSAFPSQKPNLRGTLQGEQGELGRLLGSKPGSEQVAGKVEGLMPNHPKIGSVLGSVAQGAARVGDTLLGAVAPGLAPRIPGTEAHHEQLINRQEGLLGNMSKQGLEQAQTAEGQARIPLIGAQTGEANERTRLMQPEFDRQMQAIKAGLREHELQMDDQGNISPISEGQMTPTETAQLSGLRNPWEKEAGNQPLGDRVGQLNDAMTQRYQLLNPGKPLPASLTLPANATKADFDRTDKMLQSQETASQSLQNQQELMRLREAMLALASNREKQGEEKTGLKWAVWADKSGRMVAGPASQAKAQGATDAAELSGAEVKDLLGSRHAYNLITKIGDPTKPETQGVLQLVDSLDKDGKLGVLASRFNRFMASGVGSDPGDDPRIVTLIDKGMLGDTAAMQAHFGASGGRSPLMLQHFLDLANTAKMDGGTLRAGYKAIADYMHDRGMMQGEGEGGGNVIFARDAQGKLHQAPVGTPLPTGWKEEKR